MRWGRSTSTSSGANSSPWSARPAAASRPCWRSSPGCSRRREGTVTFEGRPVAGGVPDGVGVVFQEDASFPWLTVYDNAAFGLRRSGMAAAEVRRRVDDALAFMGLKDFARAYPAQLSGGMRQRVCIARTLVLQPRLILLDEPFGALDAQTRLLMGDEVLRLWRRTGATVLLITHALDEAAMLSDRIGAMSARPGRFMEIIETGWPRERDSTIVSDAAFGEITGRLWDNLRGESLKSLGLSGMAAGMTRVGRIRLIVVVAAIAALELACRVGWIDHRVLIPPSEMATSLVSLLASGEINDDIVRTLGVVAVAIVLSVVFGFAFGLVIHALPRVRTALDPFFATYYAVPVFIFYPVLIAIFGLSPLPIVMIGVATAIVAMIIATLNGLDRVPRVLTKVARVHRMGTRRDRAAIEAAGRGALSLHRRQAVGQLCLRLRDCRRVHPVAGRPRPRYRRRLCRLQQSPHVRADAVPAGDRDGGQFGAACLGYPLGETAREWRTS